MNKYRVVLKYFAVVEDVEAENYYDAIDKAHGIGGSLQGDENEECELIEGTEPEYQWEVTPLGDSDELVAYNIAMRLSLTMGQ